MKILEDEVVPEVKIKKWAEIMIDNNQSVYTMLLDEEMVDLIERVLSGKEGIVAVIEDDRYRTFLKASRIVGVRYFLENQEEEN